MSADGLHAEQRARVLIDAQLLAAGWNVCDLAQLDLIHHPHSAVREVRMKRGSGQVDYLLYVDRKIVGVIEAKPTGTPLSGVEWQSSMYADGLSTAQQLQSINVAGRLPFVFEASGSETHFTNGYDPQPRARRLFAFPQPATLARIVRDATAAPAAPTWRAKVQHLPVLDDTGMRQAQVDAIHGIERSLAEQRHDRSLVQMATGAGKTYCAVTECYRLLKWGGFNRVLFLVDRNNLGDQAMSEFRNYTTPDDGRKFTELYNVDKLTGAGMVASSKIVVSTIQRVYAALRGQDVPDADDPGIDNAVPDRPVEVGYDALLAPEAFDLVVVDECHRSIYGLWRGVLDYFDAHVVGLTATPTKQAFGFFRQNLVSEYTYAESVAHGVNVDFDVYRIATRITAHGSSVEAGTVVPVRDKRTRAQRYEELDDDLDYTPTELDRAVMSTSQIRLVLETFRDRLYTEIFPGRNTVPKTLIFAKDDNHAEEIVTTIRAVFGKGNDFAAKITYSVRDARDQLAKFRNSPTLRVAVTVDMIATGTDVKPLECVFFMRDVRSATYFEQMKGRGARTIPDADFQAVTPDSKTKDRFVIVDAVGVTEHELIDAVPLNRDRSASLKQLLGKAAALHITEDEVATLAARLARLDQQLTSGEQAELAGLAGMPMTAVVRGLVEAVDPDRQQAAVDTSLGRDPAEVLADLLVDAVAPLAGNPALRERILEIRASHDLVIDETSVDVLLDAHGVADVDRAREIVTSWRGYLDEHRDEIAALHVLYGGDGAGKVSYAELRELADRIKRPPHNWTPDLIWNAYAVIEVDPTHPKVRRADRHTVTDLVSLVRFTLGQDNELVPYAENVRQRYAGWLLQQAQAGVDEDSLEPRFVEKFLLAPATQRMLDRMKTGISDSGLNLTQSRFLSLPIVLPPLDEQRRIVDILEDHLSRLDAADAQTLAVEAKAAAWRQSRVDGLIWDSAARHAALGSMLGEPMRNGHSARASHDGSGIRTLTLTAVTRGEFSEQFTKITTADPARVSGLWLRRGDILVERSNTPELVGTAAIYNGPEDWAIFPDLVIRVRVDPSQATSRYIAAAIRSERAHRWLRSRAKGLAGSMPKIDQGTIGALELPKPSLAEQSVVEGQLDDVEAVADRLRHGCREARKRSSALRRGLLQAAFSGRLTGSSTDHEIVEELAGV